MKLIYLFIFLISLAFNALSLEVIINPYKDIDYDAITTYNIDSSANDCTCYNSQKNDFGQDKKHWWE